MANESYDVVVIGAGNGGLTAAATTAKMGLKTLVLERHNIPGGSATSFRRGRFEFEPSLHELAGYGPADNPGDVRQLFDSLGVSVNMLPVRDAFRTIVTGPGGYDITMPAGIPEFISKMEELVPGSAESVGDFFKLAGDVGRAFAYLAAMKGNPDPAVLMSEHVNFMKVAPRVLGLVLDEIKMPEKAQEILCTYWPYMGTPRSEFTFILYALMVYRYISMLPYIPKDRSHELSLALEQGIRDAGGEIWYNTEVAKVLITDGVCQGVVTADGREIHAKQVIANISPHKVFGAMVKEDEIPLGEVKRGNARKVGYSGFCVYLGLDKSPEELGIKDYSVFIDSTPDSDESQRRMSSLEENSFLIMNCLNIDNPGCSPEGTSLLWATQLYDTSCWEDVSPRDYKALKNRIAKRLINRYEEVTGVKIHDCIEEISIASPVTYARYLNTPGGSIYGYHAFPWDSLLPRTMAIKEEQYVKGLRFSGGHSTRVLGYSSTYINGQQMGAAAALEIKEGS